MPASRWRRTPRHSTERCPYSTSTRTWPTSAATIVPEYQAGTADRGHAADIGLGRSIIPPGTAATRDFSSLAPRIPKLLAEACVGCMACVNACPDTAILATVQPRAALAEAIDAFADSQPEPAADARRYQRAVRHHAEVRGRARATRALSRPSSASSSTPVTARDAANVSRSAPTSAMTPWKWSTSSPRPPSRQSTVDRYRARMSFFQLVAADADLSTATRRRWLT